MLKKILTFFLLSLLFSGCTKSSCEEITFSSWGSLSEVQILEKIIKEFENENPKIKINFLHIPQNYFQKIHLLLASDTSPDVIFINNLYLPIYADKLEILDNAIDETIFYEQSIDALSYNQHLYAIPRDISNLVFYCNKELIKIDTLNYDFETFKKYVLNKPEGYWTIGYEPDVYYAMPYIMTFGGGILGNDYKSQNTQQALKFYKNLEGKYAPSRAEVGSSTLAQMFLDKKIALYLSGRWMYPKINEKADFEWEVLPFFGTTSLDASGWAISKSSSHKDASLKFINYLSSKQSLEYFTKTGLIVPARKDLASLLNNTKEKAFLYAIEHSQKTPVNKNYKKITDRINQDLSS